MSGRILRVTLAICIAAGLQCLSFFSGAAQAVSVSVTGPEEMVFDWTTARCDDFDIPDGTTQVLRDFTNRIQLVTPNAATRRMVGPDFQHLTRECQPIFPSQFDPNPAHFNYQHWLNGLYTENGRDVYAIVHHEWHGWEIPGACPAGSGQRRCGFVANTFAVSHDGGDTYSAPAPPDNLVSAVPPRPTIDDSRTGLAAPSNPIKKGSYYYHLSLIQSDKQDVGVCVMRTRDIADPQSWRGWDGSAFSVRFRNAFYENVTPLRTHTCEAASYENILGMSRSVTYNTALGKYVLTGSAVKFEPSQSRYVYGFFFSTSDDLVHWSMRQLIMEAPSLISHQCGGPDALAYPSLIDHDSSDRNFRITDATAYLYYVRLHYNAACQLTWDRDLLRLPLQFSP